MVTWGGGEASGSEDWDNSYDYLVHLWHRSANSRDRKGSVDILMPDSPSGKSVKWTLARRESTVPLAR